MGRVDDRKMEGTKRRGQADARKTISVLLPGGLLAQARVVMTSYVLAHPLGPKGGHVFSIHWPKPSQTFLSEHF